MREAKRQADLRLGEELRRLQADLADNWIDRSLPGDWQGLESRDPIASKKQKVTLRLDADMLRWYRQLGPGYGQRINAVLRIYWQALITGRVKSHWDEPDISVGFLGLIERLAEMGEDRED